jgi:hypothetical protein
MVLQLTSAANDALDLVLAASEDNSLVIEVDEVDRESPSEQNELIAQADDFYDSGYESLTLVNTIETQPAFVTTGRPVDLSHGDIWDEHAC